jgi:hypothetical protein
MGFWRSHRLLRQAGSHCVFPLDSSSPAREIRKRYGSYFTFLLFAHAHPLIFVTKFSEDLPPVTFFLIMLTIVGIKRAQSALILPTATGMSLTLCLLTLKQKKPQAQYVVWSRIDQKACFKSMLTAGILFFSFPTKISDPCLRTNFV